MDAVRIECFAVSVLEPSNKRQVVVFAPPARAVFVPSAHGAVFNRNWFGVANELVSNFILQYVLNVSEVCRYLGQPNGDFAFFC